VGGAACREAAGWDDRDLHLAVNVSARQLGEEFATIVDEVLAETGLAPDRLVLEVTETALLADVGAAHETLAQLKALGVRLAVDDFGVGHASLRHLRELLPVDILKIDKSFVDGIVDDAGDMAIVEAVVRLAAALGLETVAEGVEDERQAAALSALGCPAAQGFHFARPLEPERFAALIAARTA
jgi:EAL domain-containing protein (putative c-di-GMP-specific phosphodiesterase class I)